MLPEVDRTAIRDHDASIAADVLICRCAWCGAVRGDTGWRIVVQPPEQPTTHGICPPCLDAALAQSGFRRAAA